MPNEGYEHQQEIMNSIGYDDYFKYWKQEIKLDPYQIGTWHEGFADLLNSTFDLQNKIVLDVGCSGGVTSKLMKARGASEAYGIDINPNVIINSPHGDIKPFLYCYETTKMSELFINTKFDFINSHMAFEHFPSWEYSVEVAKQIYNILNKNGIFFCVLDCGEHATLEQLKAIRDSGVNIDITHTNVYPLNNWLEMFSSIGLTNITDIFCPIVNIFRSKYNFSYFENYDWHMFCFGKGNYKHFVAMGVSQITKLLKIQKFKRRNIVPIYKRVMAKGNINDNIKFLIERYK